MKIRQKIRLFFPITCLFFVAAGSAFGETKKTHGLSIYGDLKYPTDFTHLEYTNPDAPKGRSVRRFSLGSFDNLNSFILKEVCAASLGNLYDSLTAESDARLGLTSNQGGFQCKV